MQKSPFTQICQSSQCHARCGQLKTLHGEIQTPVFMPVGTQATVKGMTPEALKEIGAQIILGNTYHLYLRPGHELIREFGGLHQFMHWDRPILTDSGGFQIFSLQELTKISEEGAAFRSHLDGSPLFLSPEDAIAVQEALGSDIMMALDTCIPYPANREETIRATALTRRWAKRCREAQSQTGQLLFGIVQGGMYSDLRLEAMQELQEIGFDGYALGGLSVGEPKEEMLAILAECAHRMPRGHARYLMGVGTPEDLVEGVFHGIDMFDCVLPTRAARNAALYTPDGRITITNARYRNQHAPVDDTCDCDLCTRFTAAYLHHLFRAKEILGLRLASIHNLRFLARQMDEIRAALESGTFPAALAPFDARYLPTDSRGRAAMPVFAASHRQEAPA